MRIRLAASLAVASLMLSACGPSPKPGDGPPTPQEQAEGAIVAWMQAHDPLAEYQPLGFGDLTPRHERTDLTHHLSMQIAQEQELGGAQSPKLDSLKRLLAQNAGPLMGYIILHTYRTTSPAGEVTEKQGLFFLDSTLRVATMLHPDAFDHILNERVFYQPEPIDP